MARTLALLIAGAAVVLASACGDDDDDSGEASAGAQPYVDAMIESFDNAPPDELQIDREQAQCLAPRWVEAIGVDRLEAAGIEPRDFSEEGDVDLTEVGLSEDDGNAMYDAFGECDIDVKTVFVESFSANRDVSDEDRDCLADAMSDDLLRRIMVTTFVEGDEALNQDEELSGELFGVFADCPGLVPTSDED